MYKQIGILTGGGDAPGLNAVIRAVVRTAVGEFGMKVVGIEDSFEGILGETHTMSLTPKTVSGILPRGGTIPAHAIGEVLHGWLTASRFPGNAISEAWRIWIF